MKLMNGFIPQVGMLSSAVRSRLLCSLTAASSSSNRRRRVRTVRASVLRDDASSGIFEMGANFEETGLSATVIEKVKGLGFERPTKVQAKVIPELLDGKRDVVIAAETGCGKTHAYILPVIDAFLKEMKQNPGEQELTAQVSRFIDELDLGIQTSILAGDRFAVPDGTHIVVTTPQAFIDRAEFHVFADLRCLIVDEADMLLEGSYKNSVVTILQKFRKSLSHRRRKEMEEAGIADINSHPRDGEAQLVFVGATYPQWTGEKARSVLNLIRRKFPDIVNVRTELLHRINPLLEEEWIDVENLDRYQELIDVIQSGPEGQVMVFCNSMKSSAKVAEFLENNIEEEIAVCHRDVRAQERIAILDEFRLGKKKVLVCTDVAARGIDLGAGVSHVVQFEFANNVVHYLHRIGRTARAGLSGLATNFYDKEGRTLALEIKGENRGVLEKMFSRNRNLSNRRKKVARREQGYIRPSIEERRRNKAERYRRAAEEAERMESTQDDSADFE